MVFPRLDELTDNVKTLQPKPEDVDQKVYDLLIKTAIDKIVNDVVVFLNRTVTDLPEELDTAILLQLSGWFTDADVFMDKQERHEGTVTGTTEGDTQVSYSSPKNALLSLSHVSFIDDSFKGLLTPYRRIRGWRYE